MNPTITIVTPYKDATRYLKRFVVSLQAQTYTDWTCIMVDDQSSDDGPTKLLQLVEGDSRFTLVDNTLPKTHSGPASARNFALSLVSTDLVAFCDVDDIWHPQKLEIQVAFHCLKQLDLSVSAYGRFLAGQSSSPIRNVVCPPPCLTLGELLGRNPIPMLTVILNADLARSGFRQVPHEDFLFWLELFRENPTLRYGCSPYMLSFYCLHQDSLSGKKSHMPFWAYRVFREFGESRITSLIYLLSWALDHISFQIASATSLCQTQYSLNELLAMPPLHLKQGE